MRAFLLAAALVLIATSAQAASAQAPSAETFRPLICEFPEKGETWRIDGTGMTPIEGDSIRPMGSRERRRQERQQRRRGPLIPVELTKYTHSKHSDSWYTNDEKRLYVVVTDRRVVRLINSSNKRKPDEDLVVRGECRDADPSVPPPPLKSSQEFCETAPLESTRSGYTAHLSASDTHRLWCDVMARFYGSYDE